MPDTMDQTVDKACAQSFARVMGITRMANAVAFQAGKAWSASLDMTNVKWPIAVDMVNVLTESVFVPEDTQDTHANKETAQTPVVQDMVFAWKDLVFAARDGEVQLAPQWTMKPANACPIAQGMVTLI